MSIDKEYAYGRWRGRDIKFNRNFRGHRFTDDECAALCRDEMLTITGLVSSSGKIYGVIGKLEVQTFTNGKGEEIEFIGFKPHSFVEDLPDAWCGHQFTGDERIALKNSERLTINDFVSKDGKHFTATIHYGKNKDGRMGIIPEFEHKKQVPEKKIGAATYKPVVADSGDDDGEEDDLVLDMNGKAV